MTTTIDVSERLMKKAKKITGITEDGKMVNYILDEFLRGQKLKEMLFFKDSDAWDGYDRREDNQ